jgi:ketosteroid isomerase-like protein
MADSNRQAVERFYAAINARDVESYMQLLDKSYVWEMPQSGERVRGVENNRAVLLSYPGGLPTAQTMRISGSKDEWVMTPSWTVLKVTGSGDDYTAESKVTYPDGSVWFAIDIFHFRDGKIVSQVAYFGTALDAPDWRAPWREPG